jgi:hypothetical protein
MTKHSASATTVPEMTIDELQKNVVKARAVFAQIVALLPGLVHLSVEERTHSVGRFQGGEPDALKKLLVAAGKHPHLFAALADKDGGKDAKVFEPQPAIDDLDRIAVLQSLATDVAAFAQALGDTMLSFGADARDVGTVVHAIVKANKGTDAALANDAAEALEFYAARGRAISRAHAKAKVADAAHKA